MIRKLTLASLLLSCLTSAVQAADLSTVLAEGKEIALRAKAELGKNLMQALQQGGTVSAIEFCNLRALSITQGVSSEQNAEIKRVSDKPRNAGNRANEREAAYIASAKASLAAGRPPAPAAHEVGDRWVAYYPIPTDGMCLQCHGSPETQVSQETLSALEARYPDDEALGYGVNELRGIWVITLAKGRFT
ncbi:MAG: DUF3365 domain-containing protein [Congregibacter sp.]